MISHKHYAYNIATKKRLINAILPQKQIGASLISVMAGLFISSIFIGGLLQMYTNYIQSERFHEAQSALHDNGRFILSDLKRIIASAGLDLTQEDILGGVAGLTPEPDTAGKSDSIIISHRRTDGCNTQLATTTATEVNNVLVWVNSNDSLLCREGIRGEAIAGGVKSLQILYGIDTDGDDYPNRYVPSRLLTDSTRDDIRAVRLGLLVSSSEFTAGTAAITAKGTEYQVLDETVAIAEASQQLFKVYESTIFLRNMSSWITGN